MRARKFPSNSGSRRVKSFSESEPSMLLQPPEDGDEVQIRALDRPQHVQGPGDGLPELVEHREILRPSAADIGKLLRQQLHHVGVPPLLVDHVGKGARCGRPRRDAAAELRIGVRHELFEGRAEDCDRVEHGTSCRAAARTKTLP